MPMKASSPTFVNIKVQALTTSTKGIPLLMHLNLNIQKYLVVWLFILYH